MQTKDVDTLDAIVTAGLIAATLRFATPLAFAAMGGIFSERSGVVNIGLEGMMLMGAFFGDLGLRLERLAGWSGLLMAMLFGGLLALVHAFFSHPPARRPDRERLRDQLPRARPDGLPVQLDLSRRDRQQVSRVPDVELGFLDDIPVVGDSTVFGSLNLMVWIMFAVVLLAYIVLFKTPIGLRIRSVGEHPRAAETRSGSRSTASATQRS